MPFIRRDHTVIPTDTRADAHGQDHLNMMGGEYLSDPGFRAKLNNMGHEGAWTAEDGLYAKSHAGKGGRSLQAIISKYLDDTGLRQAGQATPSEPPAPTPAPATPAAGGAFDALEVAIGHMGLGDGSQQAAMDALDALEGAITQAAKKIRQKIAANSAWEAAVNCPRLGDLFGVQSRYTGNELNTNDFQPDDWKRFLGLPADGGGSSDGIGIAGGVKP